MAVRPVKSLKEVEFSREVENRDYLPYTSTRRDVWNSYADNDTRIVAGSKADKEFFADILKVREQTDSRWPDQNTPADDYSDHYCIHIADAPVGALGVTRLLHGPLFLHEFYPQAILDSFFDRIVSAYRFRLLPKFRRTSFLSKGTNLAYAMIREAWKEHIAKGAGIDLINVEPKYIPYYERLGYVLCEGCDFICPVFHEPISVMFLATDPSRDSVVRDLIDNRDDHIFVDDVLRVLNRKSVFIPRVAAI